MAGTLWLASLPLWASAIFVVALPTLVAMLGCAWVRRRVTLEKLTANNEVAGFKFAVLGVLYAVLLGFVVIVVWEKFRDAETAVSQEAGTVAALYRLSDGLVGDDGHLERDKLGAYIHAAIEQDWPAMSRGGNSAAVTRAVSDLYAQTLTDRPGDARGVALFAAMLTQLDALTQARRGRIVLAEGVVPGVIWAVLLLGACATVGFTFFFGTNNARAQVLMTGLLAVVVFMGLLVILSVNHPFTGPVAVGAEPLREVLREFAGGA